MFSRASLLRAQCVPDVLSLHLPLFFAAVVWAWGQKKAFGRGSEYYSVGAVGLSSLSFALQVGSG